VENDWIVFSYEEVDKSQWNYRPCEPNISEKE
jgi:hypothetical protein